MPTTQIQSSASGAQNQVLQNITDIMPSYPNTSTLNSLKFNIRPFFFLQSRYYGKVACMACAMRAHRRLGFISLHYILMAEEAEEPQGKAPATCDQHCASWHVFMSGA
jgi:hypothetical protein